MRWACRSKRHPAATNLRATRFGGERARDFDCCWLRDPLFWSKYEKTTPPRKRRRRKKTRSEVEREATPCYLGTGRRGRGKGGLNRSERAISSNAGTLPEGTRQDLRDENRASAAREVGSSDDRGVSSVAVTTRADPPRLGRQRRGSRGLLAREAAGAEGRRAQVRGRKSRDPRPRWAA